MSFELWGVVAVIVSALLTVSEFFVHFIMAKRYTDEKTESKDVRQNLNTLVVGIYEAPTVRCRKEEIETLTRIVGRNDQFYDMTADAVDDLRKNGRDADHVDSVEFSIDEAVDPVEIFAKLLEEGNVYQKGYACRRLADLQATDYLDAINELCSSRNKDLSYNAGMAVAQFGDPEKVAAYLVGIQNDKSYSNRIVNEIFEVFEGDRELLAKLLIEQCNDYMKCTVIKAIEPYKYDCFRELYKSGAIGSDKQLKIACVKALGAFGDPADEQIMQISAKDKDWVVRSAAIRGLSFMKTASAFETVRLAMYDKEWWVRRTAASSLLQMGVSQQVLEEILGGSDRFAADAMKSELYKKVGL